MSNIKEFKQNNIKDTGFTDEALDALIAQVEAEGMLHPPKGFHDDIISRICHKRKIKKNLQLFSYSMKVITATAAAIGIVLIVPGNISTQESHISGFVSEWQENDETDAQKRSQKEEERKERERNQYARKIERLQNGNFIHRINRQMDEYVDIVNVKLDQFIRMEVNINEKEEK